MRDLLELRRRRSQVLSLTVLEVELLLRMVQALQLALQVVFKDCLVVFQLRILVDLSRNVLVRVVARH